MLLSDKTVSILQNFAGINPSMKFVEGNVIKTMVSTHILASATVEEEFPQEFAIYDLRRFISCITLFQKPNIQFDGSSYCYIGEGNNRIRYQFSDNALVKSEAYSRNPKKFDVMYGVHIDQNTLGKVLKAASVIRAPNVSIESENGKVVLVAHNTKVKSSDRFEVALGESDRNFTVNFKIEDLKLYPDDYHLTVAEETITRWEGKSVLYHIATEIIS